jgi:urocanate hydratase
MLEDNLENGERPDDLIVYLARGKAARNWDCYHTILNVLKEMMKRLSFHRVTRFREDVIERR